MTFLAWDSLILADGYIPCGEGEYLEADRGIVTMLHVMALLCIPVFELVSFVTMSLTCILDM